MGHGRKVGLPLQYTSRNYVKISHISLPVMHTHFSKIYSILFTTIIVYPYGGYWVSWWRMWLIHFAANQLVTGSITRGQDKEINWPWLPGQCCLKLTTSHTECRQVYKTTWLLTPYAQKPECMERLLGLTFHYDWCCHWGLKW